MRKLLAAALLMLPVFAFATPAGAETYTYLSSAEETLTAVGDEAVASTTIPVPAGMNPETLTGAVTVVPGVQGQVTLQAGDKFQTVDANTGGFFTLDVSDQAQSGRLTVTVRNNFAPTGVACTADTTTTTVVKNLRLALTGTATPPTTVADFFSPAVSSVTLVAPEAASPATPAVLQAAASLGVIYPKAVTVSTVTASQFKPSTSVYSRALVFKTGSGPDVSVSVSNESGLPTMTMQGPPDKLTQAAAALASQYLPLAASPVAASLAATGTTPAQTQLTLTQLGAASPTLSGLGTVVTTVGVPQALFGPPVASYKVHVQGVSTPTAEGTSARVSLLWNNTMIASTALGRDDAFTLDATVEGGALGREGSLAVVLEATSVTGNCAGKALPVRIDVQGDKSTVTASPGQSQEPGFARFPQVYSPQLNIGFGSAPASSETLAQAVDLVLAQQRVNKTLLEVSVYSWTEFAAAYWPGMAVGLTSADVDALKAPLRLAPWRAVDSAGTRFTVKVDGPFAALEAFETQGRNLLVLASTPGPGVTLASELASSIAALDYGWASLNSDLYVKLPGKDPVFLSTATLVPQEEVTSEFRSFPWWLLVVILVVVGAILARVFIVRSRKARVAAEIETALAAPPGQPGP